LAHGSHISRRTYPIFSLRSRRFRNSALIIALISLAYTEEDGLVFSIGLLAGFVVIAIDLAMLWELVHGAARIRLGLGLGYR
jgi:hypothetical protein